MTSQVIGGGIWGGTLPGFQGTLEDCEEEHGGLEIQEGGTGLSGEGRQSSGCPDQASLALTVQPQPASDSEGQLGSSQKGN